MFKFQHRQLEGRKILKQLLGLTNKKRAWDIFGGIHMPAVRIMPAKTWTEELKSVQPMSVPKGLTFFLDYIHPGQADKPNKNGRIYNPINLESNLKTFADRFNQLCGELNHPTNIEEDKNIDRIIARQLCLINEKGIADNVQVPT